MHADAVKHLLIICILASFAGCDTSISNATGGPSPALVQKTSGNTRTYAQHYGVIRPSASATRRFDISNSSNDTWTVKDIETNCGCTVPTVSTMEVAPGAALEVAVAYTAPDVPFGEASRVVKVRFNELLAPEVRLLVRAAVRAPLVASPATLSFSLSQQCKDSDRTIVLTAFNFTDNNWKTVECSCSEPWLKAVATKISPIDDGVSSVPARQAWAIAVTVTDPILPPGFRTADLVVINSDDSNTQCVVPIRLNVALPFTLSPSRLFLGEVRPREHATSSVDIKFNEDHPQFRPGSVSTTHDGPAAPFELKWTKRSDRQWTITVETRFDAHPGDFVAGRLLLSLGKSMPSVSLPYSARIVDN